MMRSVFVDANIVLDWLNADSARNAECTRCLETICVLYKKPLVSPTTLATVFYMVGKKIKDKHHIKKILHQALSQFQFTLEDQDTIDKVFQSHDLDLEDGLQYFSAMHAKADAIITYNLHDYIYAKIPVLHPKEFLDLHEAGRIN